MPQTYSIFAWTGLLYVCTRSMPLKSIWGRCLAQLVEQVSHVQRLCPRCRCPRFEPQLWTFCCMSLPLSLILFPVISYFLYYQLKNKYLKKTKTKKTESICVNLPCYIFWPLGGSTASCKNNIDILPPYKAANNVCKWRLIYTPRRQAATLASV